MQYNSLESSVRTLKKLRDAHHGQLDVSVVAELDSVIGELERIDAQVKGPQLESIGLRALQVIAVVLNLISNIKDLIK
ncbi:hypothetical protein E2K99_14925 [Herbaspirillum huttiense]|uniref:Uncharacterized protein n=1 Tax=Herbaspirillum seropedicae (strain SmR1) TaxID=757424 RepID=D8IZQ5_HERSS|nr:MULTISPECIES: hypothetical protein [Herbaspirillum]ADJ64395.1 conserved hypothetical protein [Herbaspirillum seropedicae SmR1]AKN66327.1 hypothetical protein ACP92_14560 [Herbaspirillum seropedicae]NQE30567.1 hypothetical protein [Herbaspirillum seropedicae]QBP76223.1 hypothetical protein E2K99_14925 [Herbaspirillum huttiense]UMU22319.1 hypothetical protein G5B88_14705 [Herbaspirillum seropedicae]